MNKILQLVIKNFQTLFRNWTSLLVLILGPAIIILIIGIVLGSMTIQTIPIGTTQQDILQPLLRGSERVISLNEYPTIDMCIEGLKRSDVFLCVDIPESFSNQSITQGEIIIYHDNSQSLISEAMLSYMNQYLSGASRDIAIRTARQLISHITQIQGFIDESSSLIDDYIIQSQHMVAQMKEFQTQINTARTSMRTIQNDINRLDQQIRTGTAAVGQATGDIYQEIGSIRTEIRNRKQQIENLNAEVQGYIDEIATIRTQVIRAQDEVRDLLNDNHNLDNASIELLNEFIGHDVDSIIGMLVLDDIKRDLTTVQRDLDESERTLANYQGMTQQVEGEIPRVASEFEMLVRHAESMITFTDMVYNNTQQGIEAFETNIQMIQQFKDRIDSSAEGFIRMSPQEAQSIIMPLTMKDQPLLEDKPHIYLLFPVVFPIIALFICMLFSNIIMIEELHSPAQFRNFILPLKDSTLLIGFFITNFIISWVQMGVILLYAYIQLGIPVHHQWVQIALTTSLLITIFSSIGMSLAYLAKSKENSILITTFLSVGILFTGTLIIPTQLMHPIVSTLVNLNPTVIASWILRQALFYNIPLALSWIQYTILSVYSIGCLLLLYHIVHKHRHWYK